MGIRTAKNRDKFYAHVRKLRKEGKCVCFDCLREDGFTPPLSKRNSFPCVGPWRVFGKDPGGEPELTQGKGAKHGEQDEPGSDAEERSHLKEAVANRAAI